MAELTPRLLIVDDEIDHCTLLTHLMEREGFKTAVAYDGETALKAIRTEPPDVVLLDVKMPGMDGMQVLKIVKEENWELPIIIITAFADIPGAVKAICSGAENYLSKPFDHQELLRVVRQSLIRQRLKRHAQEQGEDFFDNHYLNKIMGPSDAVKRLVSSLILVAPSDFTVVLIGETGSGKELVAHAIHQSSARPKGPFIPVDCGAIPEALLESELFGHEKGAFTSAVLQKPGKFEMAQGGCLFLDEISNMPFSSQAKLLRALQEKKIYRVGGTRPLNIDVRLVVASNLDLRTLVDSGTFRRDLFFRLNEFTILIPPLRGRKDDIPYLAKLFLDATNKELNKKVKGFTESAVEALVRYDWPGNARQLRSVIRRAVLLADQMVTEELLEIKRVDDPGLAFTPKVKGAPWKDMSLKEIVRCGTQSIEREVIAQVLKHTGGNKARAARILHIDYKTIHTKVKDYQIRTDGD
ncbi:MAG: sigma-54 dependent transcriptional regulator [Syntrophobacteraceae bacterium]|jgi:two-component system nitrogen regulation response regulator GlnG